MPKSKSNLPKIKIHRVDCDHGIFHFKSITAANKFAAIIAQCVKTRTHWLDDDPDFPDAKKFENYEYLDPKKTSGQVTINLNIEIEKSKRKPPRRKGLPAPRLGLPAPK